MTAVRFNNLNASGPLEGFGQLTALTNLDLYNNSFSGARGRSRPQAASMPRPPAACLFVKVFKGGK